MSGYSEGVRIEHLVMHDLTDNGYECTRAASSKGVADVIAIKAGQVLLVNVKRTTMPGPAERRSLLEVAMMLPGIGMPLVALKPLRQELTYRALYDTGPKDWVQWSPDFVDEGTVAMSEIPMCGCRPDCTCKAGHANRPDFETMYEEARGDLITCLFDRDAARADFAALVNRSTQTERANGKLLDGAIRDRDKAQEESHHLSTKLAAIGALRNEVQALMTDGLAVNAAWVLSELDHHLAAVPGEAGGR